MSVLHADLAPVSSEVGDVGSGRAEVVLLPNGTFLWRLALQGVQEMTKAHIHQGPPGEAGPVVAVFTPTGGASVSGPGGRRGAAQWPTWARRSVSGCGGRAS